MALPNHKHPRLKEYDYSLPGYYYVTVHTKDGSPRLSSVGRGLAPAASASIRLTAAGKIVTDQLLALESRFPGVRIDKYVIMPTHIHAIIQLSPSPDSHPTLMDVLRVFKSLATRECNRVLGASGNSLFQSSFYETVLRSEKAYQEAWRYIEENPAKWVLDPEDL